MARIRSVESCEAIAFQIDDVKHLEAFSNNRVDSYRGTRESKAP
jgi:hypothetical protein